MRDDCSWCGKDTAGGPVFTLSASFNEKGKSFAEEEGYIDEFKFSDGKEIWVMITGEKSPAKNNGQDMLFMCCSNKCARKLKEKLKAEKDFLDSISFF